MRGKRWIALLLAAALGLGLAWPVWADEESPDRSAETAQADGADETPPEGPETAPETAEVAYDPTAGNVANPVPDSTAQAMLVMDAATGTVLWSQNEGERREPASVTKIMTMLLVCEAIDAGQLSLDTVVTASAHAAEMGGSQVYLEEGEQMTVDELLKAVAVASGNDAAVALGEAVSGSEAAFVEKMNRRAAELGMEDTHFANCTGLPDESHLTSARDIARMSRALLEHDLIRDYTTIWTDSLRGGEFGLASTNKLLRSYSGITGLKTGFTNDAGFCMSATAERNGMELIAVVLGAENSKDRFNTAATLLDFGFANFKNLTCAPEELPAALPVEQGTAETAALTCPPVSLLIRAADEGSVATRLLLPEALQAPVTQGETVGFFLVEIDGALAARVPVTAGETVDRLTFGDVLLRFLRVLVSGGEQNLP